MGEIIATVAKNQMGWWKNHKLILTPYKEPVQTDAPVIQTSIENTIVSVNSTRKVTEKAQVEASVTEEPTNESSTTQKTKKEDNGKGAGVQLQSNYIYLSSIIMMNWC